MREPRYGLLNDVRRLDKRALPMTMQRFAALGLDPAAPAPTDLRPRLARDRWRWPARWRRWASIRTQGAVLVLRAGAEYGPAKRWPARHFAAVARHYPALGMQVWLVGLDRDAPPSRRQRRRG